MSDQSVSVNRGTAERPFTSLLSEPDIRPSPASQVATNSRKIQCWKLAFRVAGPGADYAFLAAELVALAHCGIQRTRNARLDRVSVRSAGVCHVDRQSGASTPHRQRGADALALFERHVARAILGRIVIRLAISAAFADGECSRSPRRRSRA